MNADKECKEEHNKAKTACTILMVEDDEGLLHVAQRRLRQAGFHSAGALNGAEAIDRIVDNHVTLLLLDYKLSDMTGKQLIETLEKRGCKVPFIVITGHGDEETAVEMMKLGACDYIVKDSALLDRLPTVVRRALDHLAVGKKLAETEEERKELRTQLQESRKMEAVATLAGGMAHEYNNALAAISGNLELLKMDLADYENIQVYIEPMIKSTRRMVKLTSQLLAYARGGKYGPQAMSLSDFIEETLPILQHTIDSEIMIETDLSRNICVRADPTQMQMVLSAVLTNAAEAIETVGCISISARGQEVDEEFANQHPDLKPGPYVHLSVEDNGKGMDEETRARIFEPFFTTKFQGRGLGMAAAYGIVTNHDGCVWVDSEPGKGTVVHICLPCADVEKKEAAEPEVAMGTGTILVIEDEEDVMDVTRKILEKLGYHVLTAASGTEAIDIARSYGGDIDLAILDVGLPNRWGKKVYDLIMEVLPDLKVIVCSGYGLDGPAQEVLMAGAQSFIQKPYSLPGLSEKVKDVLDGK